MFVYTSVKDYLQQLDKGTVTCVKIVQHYLARINTKRNLNAFVYVFSEEAMQKAEELDIKRKAGEPCGKLHGVIVAIKDVICYRDHPVSAASAMLKDFTSVYSSTVIEKLLQEDAIIIGTCNCDEFAMGSSNENSVYGPVLNEADNTRVPGGSSGGSAVAVQAGLCMIALGSDTGGSVRQPADFCGIYGLKPTYGRVSRYGLIAYASSFDQIGIFASCTEDIAIALEVISGTDEYDSTVSDLPVENFTGQMINAGKKFRIAFFGETLEHPSLDPEIAGAIRNLIKTLSNDGHSIEDIPFEYLDYIVPAYYILTTAEASSNLSRYDGVRYGHRSEKKAGDITAFYMQNRSEGFGREVKRRIMLGTFVLSTGYYDAYYAKAQKVRRKIVDKTNEVFEQHDLLLMPVAPSTAFKLGEKTDDPVAMYLADIYTVFANLAGIPGLSVPLFRNSSGMPFGIQLMSNRFCELSLLQASHQMTKYKM